MQTHNGQALLLKAAPIAVILLFITMLPMPAVWSQGSVTLPQQVDIFLPVVSGSVPIQQSVLTQQSDDSGALHRSDDLVDVSIDQLEAAIDLDRRVRYDVRAAAVSGPPNQIGLWEAVVDTPVVPVFAALLPNKSVLMWDSVGDGPTESSQEHNFTRAAVWYPENNSSRTVNVSGYNIFCAGFVHMPDGRLLVAGGNKNSALEGIRQTHIFDFQNNSWSRGQDMAGERWYPSLASMANGETFIMGGGPSDHEVYQTDGSIRQSVRLSHPRTYPFIQATVGGKILYAGPQSTMRMIDATGSGSYQNYGNLNGDGTYRSYASYAMYDVGRTLVSGGATPARREAVLIDANDGSPSSALTGVSMSHRWSIYMTQPA